MWSGKNGPNLFTVNELRIPRCLCYEPFFESAVDRVVFCDASSCVALPIRVEKWYCSCGYLHCEN